MKLDVGDPATLACINRPDPAVKLERIVAGLKGIPSLVVQSVLVDGAVTNGRGEPFEAWLAVLAGIGPAHVQTYSTDRPMSDVGVERVPPATLQRIAREVEHRTRLPVDAYWA
ncbi:MAG TPA: hypothetical protein VMY40_02960 [Anaerolineae bacterium]|nr:hypothetical protein [Anaerolineae bacterium]